MLIPNRYLMLSLSTLACLLAQPHEVLAQLAVEQQEAAAEEETEELEPLTHYLGRRIAPTMGYQGASWLTRAERQEEEDCATMFRELRLKPGMTACDMGCGNGFYTLQMAEAVGEGGRVLAVDIQPEMLRLMQARAGELELQNINSVLGTVSDPKLPQDASVDLVLCVDVYHEFSFPQQMLTAIRKSLKPDGVVVLVEYREEDPTVPIRPLHKMSKKQVNKELIANGFRLVREFDQLPWQHMMFFSPNAAAPSQAD